MRRKLNIIRLFGLYLRTIRYLRPIQIGGRLAFKVFSPKPQLSPIERLPEKREDWTRCAARNQSFFEGGRFSFLNVQASLADNGWDGPEQEKLWRYNQHYFDDLNAADAECRSRMHKELIDRWREENPPTIGTGWEPYPTSLRIVNWVKWALAGGELDELALHSLVVQARWLVQRIEWHILGNHLFANAKALVFVGLYIGGDEGRQWRSRGNSILLDQLQEQFLPDGGQFERSPMYHALAVEDVLDLVNLLRTFDSELEQEEQSLLAELEGLMPAMLNWLSTMSHPDGEIAFFNDAAMGVAPSNREIFEYADRLGFNNSEPLPAAIHLKDSGYVSLRRGQATLLIDAAPIGPDYLPGHAHADTLSFELSLGKQRVIVNSGTSVYGTGVERLRQRGTASHSTLMLNGENSSEVWSGFRVGRRARILCSSLEAKPEYAVVTAAHDGYSHMRGAPVHKRIWNLQKSCLVITDTVKGMGSHKGVIRFHLPASISVSLADDCGTAILKSYEGEIICQIAATANSGLFLEESWWHPEFGTAEPSICLSLEIRGALPLQHEAVISWNEK